MHMWGDEGVDWEGINDAAAFIGYWLAKYARINVRDIKEKFGTVRIYCSFGFDTFYSIYRPRHCWVPTWWPWKLDLKISGYVMPFINRFIIPIHVRLYVWRYKKAVQKWPHLYKEIVSMADCGELFEGQIPDYKHSDYWTELK